MRTQKPMPGGGGGGASVFADLRFTELGKNKLSEGGCQDLWLKISRRGTEKYFIVGIIYRHLKSGVNKFLTTFNDKLVQLNKNNFTFYISEYNKYGTKIA